MRHFAFIPIVFMLTACGSTSLSGTSGKNGAGEKKDAPPEGGSDDEQIVDAKPSAPVSGAFLVFCGEAPDADGATAPAAGSVWYGCGVFDAAKAKLDRKIETVSLTFTDGVAHDAAFVPAAPTSRYSTLTAVVKTRIQLLSAVSVKVAGELAATSATLEPAVLVDDPVKELEVPCPVSSVRNLDTRKCEDLIPIEDFIPIYVWNRIEATGVPPGEILFFKPEGTEEIRFKRVDDPVFYALAPTKCAVGTRVQASDQVDCALRDDGTLADGTVPIFDILKEHDEKPTIRAHTSGPDAVFLENEPAEVSWRVHAQRLRLVRSIGAGEGKWIQIHPWHKGTIFTLGTSEAPFYPDSAVGFKMGRPLGYAFMPAR